jgi:hypothetical protein
MYMRLASTLAGAMLAVSPVALQAATFTRYLDRDAFAAAAGSVAVETFAGYAAPTTIGSGIDAGKFTVVETHYGLYGGGSQISPGTRPSSIDGTNFLEAVLYDAGATYGSYLTFTFDKPITAFGGNWASGSINTVYLDVLGEQVDQQVGNAGGFFGFVSDTPFTTLVMRSRLSNHRASLDNLTFSYTAGAVPEPASWAMMVGGFGLLGGALRRRAVRSGALPATA